MNALSNHVHLIGRLGADPEVRKFENSQKVSLRLATNESHKDQNGEYVTNTLWHNVVAWGKVCDVLVKLLKKGHQVAVTGKLNYGQYEDKEGNKKHYTEIVLRDFMKLTHDKKE